MLYNKHILAQKWQAFGGNLKSCYFRAFGIYS